jgi:hypothetical protein
LELHRRGYLANFDPDRLLFHYRALAGLPQAAGIAPGTKDGRADFCADTWSGITCPRLQCMAIVTDDSSFASAWSTWSASFPIVRRRSDTEGYLAAFPSTVFDWVEGKPADNGGIVVPYYTVHKAHGRIARCAQASGRAARTPVVTKMADYLAKRCAALDAQQLEQVFRTDGGRNPQNEFGAMSDVLAQLFEVTAEQRHLQAAQVFNRAWFVEPLARGEDRLAGLHANTHIAQAIGGRTVRQPHRRFAAGDGRENFWRLVARDHSFVNGGNHSTSGSIGRAWRQARASTDATRFPRRRRKAATRTTCSSSLRVVVTSSRFRYTATTTSAR